MLSKKSKKPERLLGWFASFIDGYFSSLTHSLVSTKSEPPEMVVQDVHYTSLPGRGNPAESPLIKLYNLVACYACPKEAASSHLHQSAMLCAIPELNWAFFNKRKLNKKMPNYLVFWIINEERYLLAASFPIFSQSGRVLGLGYSPSEKRRIPWQWCSWCFLTWTFTWLLFGPQFLFFGWSDRASCKVWQSQSIVWTIEIGTILLHPQTRDQPS